MNNLVRRLRESRGIAPGWQSLEHNPLCTEAANRIEWLEDQVAQLQGENAAYDQSEKEAREQLIKLQGALGDWLHFAREELSEFDIDGESCDGEALCPGCRNSGCIQLKIRNSHALLTDEDGNPQ